MKRTLVISDIHGESVLFEQLLSTVQYNPRNDQLILLGDYIDRGTNSKNVLDKVIELKAQGAFVLKGNHEDMMIKALTTDDERAWKHWVHRNGGFNTLQSYGFCESECIVLEDKKLIKSDFHTEKLDGHLAFLQSLDPLIEHDNYVFVHAGIHPTTPIAETDPYILMWIREEFYTNYNGVKTIIFGHTPTSILHHDKNNHSIYFGENRIIGIDGSAVYGGQLNCLELPTKAMHYVKK